MNCCNDQLSFCSVVRAIATSLNRCTMYIAKLYVCVVWYTLLYRSGTVLISSNHIGRNSRNVFSLDCCPNEICCVQINYHRVVVYLRSFNVVGLFFHSDASPDTSSQWGPGSGLLPPQRATSARTCSFQDDLEKWQFTTFLV